MSTDLKYKKQNIYGQDLDVSDLQGSGKWNYAGTKIGLSEEQTTNAFKFWDEHAYTKNARYGMSQAGKGTGAISYGPATPFSGGGGTANTIQLAKGMDGGDAFSALRSDRVSKNYDYSNKDGVVSYYAKKYKTQYGTGGGPMGGQTTWSDTKPTLSGVQGPMGGPMGGNQGTRQALNTQTRKVAYRGAKTTGRMLNNAFVSDDVFGQMSDQDKQFYGLTAKQAGKLDPNLNAANQIVDGAYQYRRMRSRKKSGIGGVMSMVAPKLLTAAGAAFGGPVGGAIGGAIGGGLTSGGDLGAIARGGVEGGISGFGAKVGGDIWSGAGGAANNAGPVALSNGGSSSMGGATDFLGNLFGGGQDFLSNIGGNIGDIFSGGGFDSLKNLGNTAGNFLSGKGKGGGFGDILNFATGGQSGNIGNLLSGISGGGGIGSLLSGGAGLFQALSGGGATPGINPGASGGGGGGASSGGGGGSGSGGGINILDLLLGGGKVGGDLYLNEKQADAKRDAGKKGADVADPFRHSRNIYEDKLNALYNDPSSLTSMPNFQFGFDQGNKAMQRARDAGGYATSGNALIEAQQYGQDYSQKYFNDEVSRLSQLSGAAGGQMGAAGSLLAGGYDSYANKYKEIGGTVGNTLKELLNKYTGGPGNSSGAPSGGGGGSSVDMINAITGGSGGGTNGNEYDQSGGIGDLMMYRGGQPPGPNNVENVRFPVNSGSNRNPWEYDDGSIGNFARLH